MEAVLLPNNRLAVLLQTRTRIPGKISAIREPFASPKLPREPGWWIRGYAECVPIPVFISAFSERPPFWEPLFWRSRWRYWRCRRFAGSTPHQSTALLKVIACLLSPPLFGLCRRSTQSSRVFLKDALMHPIGTRTGFIPPRSQAAASAERTGPFSRPHAPPMSILIS